MSEASEHPELEQAAMLLGEYLEAEKRHREALTSLVVNIPTYRQNYDARHRKLDEVSGMELDAKVALARLARQLRAVFRVGHG